MWVKKISQYYKMGIWNQLMVKNAVIKGKISMDEYNAIICGK